MEEIPPAPPIGIQEMEENARRDEFEKQIKAQNEMDVEVDPVLEKVFRIVILVYGKLW